MVIAGGFIKPPRKRPAIGRGGNRNTLLKSASYRREPVSRAAGSVRVAPDPGLRRDDARAIRP